MGNKFIIAAACLLIGAASYAQYTPVKPPTSSQSQQAAPTPAPAPAPQPKPVSASLACIGPNGERESFSIKDWTAMPKAERKKYGKAGIEVLGPEEHFTIGLRDLPGVTSAYARGQVPTPAQWSIIIENAETINNALEAAGGDTVDPAAAYWSKGEEGDGLKTARLCAQGASPYGETVMTPGGSETYETVGETIDGITVGICGERYGYVDADGRCVVPAKYEYLSVYGAACDNGLYGMIDLKGEVKAPFVYDGMIAGKHLTVVYQEGDCGALDREGRVVIPIEFQDIVPGRTSPVAMACLDGAYALTDAAGRKLTPHTYDRVVSAQDYGFAVSRDGKSIYLGIDGKEYGNADDMAIGVLEKNASPEGRHALARLLYDRKSYFEAMKHAEAAASAGYAPAQCLMGHFYANGRGAAAKSDTKAFEWYEKAARQGWDEACYHLALMYEKGRGVYRNPKLAAEWYEKSNGYLDANERMQQLDPAQKPTKTVKASVNAKIEVRTQVNRNSYCK